MSELVQNRRVGKLFIVSPTSLFPIVMACGLPPLLCESFKPEGGTISLPYSAFSKVSRPLLLPTPGRPVPNHMEKLCQSVETLVSPILRI